MSSLAIAEKICMAMRMLYLKGLITPLAGNISVRVDSRILVTPSAKLKFALQPEDIVEVDLQGRVLRGDKPTSELPMHLGIYRVCKECRAVVHIHGVYAPLLRQEDIALLPMDVELEYVLRPRICFVHTKPPGSTELASAVVKEVSSGCSVVILERHGIVAVGNSLELALELAEAIELAAKRMLSGYAKR